jgi:hypothetical protein
LIFRVAALGNVRPRLQPDAVVVEFLHDADAQKLVQNGAKRDVTAEAARQRGEARAPAGCAFLEGEDLGIAFGVGEFRVAYPAGDHACGSVVSLARLGVVDRGRFEQSLHFLAGEPREQGDPGHRCLLAWNAEFVRGHLDIGMLGNIDEGLERHVIT